MSRTISRAEAWERAHEVFTQVNFNAFDYNTIKESLLDYVKLYFPEDFNDYIESSEFIAILELFAYIGELLAYRLDLNAHENFITTAERKESILRLAKLISYKASRNIPARGLVKMTSVQTTERILDSNGRDLSGRRIFWNDANNPDWKEQFFLIINRVLEQQFGSVEPSERVQVDDVLFELYSLNNNPITNNGRSVISYSATASNGAGAPMELVPVELTENGPVEKRPEINGKFSILYGNDGLGDSSDTTGFLMFTKQGSLAFQTQTFDGITPNQTFDLEIDNINETDIWLNNVDSDTGEILVNDPFADILPHLVSEELRYGEWIEVDLANAQNITFNTNRNRRKFEIETLDNDTVRIIFGDGEFSDIPGGTFHIWYRTSLNENFIIERSSVINQTGSLTYNDQNNTVQTLSFTFSLISSLQNASPSEDIEHIRRVAPSVYYTQDRMVNGRDYNVFMLQDPSILKLRAINRTFSGDSKYIAWNDPRENYDNVKLFGDDLALYWVERDPEDGALEVINTAVSSEELLDNYIEPLLSTTDFFAKLAPLLQEEGLNPDELRRTFKGSSQPYSFGIDPNTGKTFERASIIEALDQAATTTPIVYLYYSVKYDEWTVGDAPTSSPSVGHPCDQETTDPTGSPLLPPAIPGCTLGNADSVLMARIEARFQGSTLSGWDVRWRTRRLIAQSEETRFWNTNETTRIINFDTLNSRGDNIVVLQANENANGTGLLDANRNYFVLGQELVEQNLPNAGLPDIHKLSVLPEDQNEDGIPDNLLQPLLLDAVFEYTWTATDAANIDAAGTAIIDIQQQFGKTINNSTAKGLDEDILIYVNGTRYTFDNDDLAVSDSQTQDLIVNEIGFTQPSLGKTPPSVGDTIEFVFKDYVYFSRDDELSPWIPQQESDTIRTLFLTETTTVADEQRYKREEGRYPLNFAWFHYVPRFNLVDPSATNIIDSFIITTGYYTAIRRWLANQTDVEPTPPTPLELRSTYAELLDNKMISDTVVLHPGKFKILFGSRAIPQLRAKFKIIRPESSSLTDNQVKVRITEIVRRFFNIQDWEFGETFYFSELTASIHAELGPEIDSIVLVPLYAQNQFGDLYQVQAREDELFLPDISTSDIEIIPSLTPQNIRQFE